MRPLNRPMFKYGGPIKEGIMDGMKDRPRYFLGGLTTAGSVLMAGLRASPRFAKNIFQGFRSGKYISPFDSGITKTQRFRNLFPTGNFRQTKPIITRSNKPTIDTKGADYSPINIKPGEKLGFGQIIKDPKRIGAAIAENPGLAISSPSLLYSAGEIGGPVVGSTLKGIANFLVPGTKFDPFKDKGNIKETGGDTEIVRLDKNKTVASGDTGGDPNTSAKTDAEKQKINEDRINETKQKYYKLMGIDKMNKEATYDSLIDASKIIQAEGGDLKGAIKSGSLQSQLISAISKNLDKSADLKKKIDSAVLTAEIQKDINKTKMSDFDKQLAILGPEGYRRKALGETSVAEMIAATKAKNTLVNSDIVTSFIESKGGKVTDTFDDTKFQKWEKNNTGKDEIDYITENFSTIDPGVYVVNGKAVQIGISEEGKKTANYINLDTIIG